MKKLIFVVLLIAVAISARLVFLSQQSYDPEPIPVINVMDILSASDLVEGVRQAVEQNDEKLLSDWIARAVEVAEAAKLSQGDIEWLQSEQARDYLVFNAKRNLFNQEFEKRYANLQGIDDLKAAYPEAKNFFEKAEALLAKRDQIIYNIAQTLAEGDEPTPEQLEQARAIWRERHQKTDDKPSDSA